MSLEGLLDLTRALECCQDHYCKDCPYRDTENCYEEWLKNRNKTE